MHAVIRRYAHASDLIAVMAERAAEVERVISSSPGFVQYHALRDGDALTTITVCQDKAGTDESSRRAAGWVKDNLPISVVKGLTPEVTECEPFIAFGAPQRLGSPARA